MKATRFLLLAVLFTGCAHLRGGPSESWQRARLWDEAHGYFATGDFARADSMFGHIAATYPETNEGREAHFYRGAVALDPRNPRFDPAPAERHLQLYLRADSAGGRIHRRPEGETLFQLAHQLALPMDQRIEALRGPEPRTTVVVAPRETAAPPNDEAQRLRREIASRDETIRELRDELDRIRKTLTGQAGQ